MLKPYCSFHFSFLQCIVCGMIGKLETVLLHAGKEPGKTPEQKKLKLISGVTNVTALILLLKHVASRIAEVYEMLFP